MIINYTHDGIAYSDFDCMEQAYKLVEESKEYIPCIASENMVYALRCLVKRGVIDKLIIQYEGDIAGQCTRKRVGIVMLDKEGWPDGFLDFLDKRLDELLDI